jgi:hypothetical protein
VVYYGGGDINLTSILGGNALSSTNIVARCRFVHRLVEVGLIEVVPISRTDMRRC